MPVIQYSSGRWAVRGSGEDSGTLIDCEVEFSRDRMQWHAVGRPASDAPTIETYADSMHGAALACFAKWLGCEADLADALRGGSRRG